jgi:threonine dehydratase
MQIPAREQIDNAWDRIRAHVRRTPTITVDGDQLDLRPDVRVTLKLESLQHTGSFKPRGAFNFVLSNEAPEAGLIAASGGNHGLAVAHVARRLGLAAEIFVPEAAPKIKVERLRSLGANVQQVGALYDDAREASELRAAETGALVVPAYDDPEIVAGAGTLGRELMEQEDSFQTVMVAVGGGGLIAGVSAWLRGDRSVVSVESRGCSAMHAALRAGRATRVDVRGLASDSLGARQIGELPLACAKEWVDSAILVPDSDIRRAQRLLWDRLRIIAEPGGATALAGALSGEYRFRGGEHIALLVCGANVDPAVLSS